MWSFIMRSTHNKFVGRRATAATMAVALVLGGGAVVATSASASGSSAVANGIALAKSHLAHYTAIPKFKAPGPAFNAKKDMKNKIIFSIPVNSSDQFVQTLEDGMAAAAKKVGFKFVDYQNSGSPAQWTTGMNEAISEHVSVIDLLSGIDPKTLEPQIKLAKAAGIKVISSDTYGLGQAADPLLSGTVDAPYGQTATLQADWMTVHSDGKGQILLVGSSDVAASSFGLAAEQKEFKLVCPNCKVYTINVPVADWATTTGTQVQAQLQAHPNLDYISPLYDSQSQFIIPAITTANKVGKIHIVSYDGTPFVLGDMQTEKGKIVEMDVGEDLEWVSLAIIDNEMRIASGLKSVANEGIPLLIFDTHNVNTTGTPPVNSKGYGSSGVSGYYKLWGL
jgi:ribose transport system substrate-binding protein